MCRHVMAEMTAALLNNTHSGYRNKPVHHHHHHHHKRTDYCGVKSKDRKDTEQNDTQVTAK